jgi:hypothetical protein
MQNESGGIVPIASAAQPERYEAPAIEERAPLVGVLCPPSLSPGPSR